jgi:uncharacterized protein (TIGR00288 family)
MNNYFSRTAAAQWAPAAAPPQRTARSAALLIDFDNVTLGVHSDLGRELKTLINSEVFRGKIAVRRAYADWRRFPNYVVPLTEASIDLIFAPAYGSSKKNTTDLRMSADAIELAFTRPEIDTFILLTGDSDFSSTVMKLKEYGKFVIGVGMRESSSDLIIQNCDEYFSYHALTGLTRTTAGEGMREDPWELVVRAAHRMASTGDAMRTDRLKQVMLSLDPGFNEKEIGYSKFSKFVAEADKKGLLKLVKLPDGQYEISVDGVARPAASAGTETRESREPRERRDREPRRDRDRDRQRRGDRERGPRRDAEEAVREPAAAAEPSPAETEVGAAPAEPEVISAVVDVEPTAAAPAAPVAPAAAAGSAPPEMEYAVTLLQRAIRALAGREGAAVRDGDVKRRMLEMDPSFDESELGFSKFSRFLRHAHDLEAIDLTRLEGGQYEAKIGSRRYESAAPVEVSTQQRGAKDAAPAAPSERKPDGEVSQPAAEAPRRGRGRGRGRTADAAAPPPLLPGQVVGVTGEAAPPTEVSTPPAEEKAVGGTASGAEAAETRIEPAEEASEAAATPRVADAHPAPRRGRRGRRGAPASEQGPPPPLPGQVVGIASRERQPEPEQPEASVRAPASELPAESADEMSEAAPEAARKRRRGGRGRKRAGDGAAAAAAPQEPEAPPAPEFSAEALGLPTERGKIENYLTKSYKGVGKKTVEPMLDAFGDDIFRVFAEEPQRVQEVLGDKRAATVLEQWAADFERREADLREAVPAAVEPGESVAETAVEPAAEEAAGAEGSDDADAAATRTRRRGGRGRGKRGKAEAKGDDEIESAPTPEPEAPASLESAEPESDGAGKSKTAASRGRSRSRGGRGRSGKGNGKAASE